MSLHEEYILKFWVRNNIMKNKAKFALQRSYTCLSHPFLWILWIQECLLEVQGPFSLATVQMWFSWDFRGSPRLQRSWLQRSKQGFEHHSEEFQVHWRFRNDLCKRHKFGPGKDPSPPPTPLWSFELTISLSAAAGGVECPWVVFQMLFLLVCLKLAHHFVFCSLCFLFWIQKRAVFWCLPGKVAWGSISGSLRLQVIPDLTWPDHHMSGNVTSFQNVMPPNTKLTASPLPQKLLLGATSLNNIRQGSFVQAMGQNEAESRCTQGRHEPHQTQWLLGQAHATVSFAGTFRTGIEGSWLFLLRCGL